jgi:hypothetical protein
MSLLEIKLANNKGWLANLVEAEMNLLVKFKMEDLNYQVGMEFMVSSTMPSLNKIKLIDAPIFDFHKIVFSMEDEFLAQEEDINPNVASLIEHPEMNESMKELEMQ